MPKRNLIAAAVFAASSTASLAAVNLPGLSILPITHPAPTAPATTAHISRRPRIAETTHPVWSVTLSPRNPALLHKLEHQVRGASGMTIAESAVASLHRDGYPMVHAILNPVAHHIEMQVATFPASGALSGYLSRNKLVTVAWLNAALPLLSAAAVSQHEHVNLGLNETTMTLDPSVNPAPGRSYGGGLVLSSYGPRYAGSDVMSSYAYAHVDGYDISGSITRGLPDWTPKQSQGGAYVGEDISVDHPTPDGILSVDISHAHFMVGGELRPLKLRGYVTQISGEDKYPLFDGKLWVRGGLAYASDRERLAALNWGTDQNNLSAYAGINGNAVWHGTVINLRASVYQGLAGSDVNLSGSPDVMGRWSAHYTVERVNLSAVHNFGPIQMSGEFGAQHGSARTPQVMQAYIGGQGRGSSFFTGAYAGPSGYWYSADVAKAAPVILHPTGQLKLTATPFITINGGTVFPVLGVPDHVDSIGGGVRFSLASHLSGQIGYSRTIVRPAGAHQASLFNFELVSRF